jgi:hypothetical protein
LFSKTSSPNYVITGEKKGGHTAKPRVFALLEDGGGGELTQSGLRAHAEMCTNTAISSLLEEFPTGFCRDAKDGCED